MTEHSPTCPADSGGYCLCGAERRRRPPGRPPKGADKRTARNVRASPEEWKTIEARAAEAGLSVSAYMRGRALAE